MRAAPLLSLLIPAVLGAGLGLTLVSCHKDPPAAVKATVAPARRLKLEAYMPDIPKAPVAVAKLDTTIPHPPVVTEAPTPAPVVGRQAEAAPPLAMRVPGRAPPRPAQRPYAYAEPGSGRYVEARGFKPYDPDDPRADADPQPEGFRLTLPICRRAERQGDPLSDTQECQGMLQTARITAERCAQAYDEGDDRVVLSAACRQSAMGR